MSKVECCLLAKTEIGGCAVDLDDEHVLAIRSFSRVSGEETHRYIEDDTPHHFQFRPRDTVKRLQLLKNWRSYKQRLWESERILRVENT